MSQTELKPKPQVINLDTHQADLARRKAERDERTPYEERLRLCNPVYAAELEMRKPQYKYVVKCTFHQQDVKTGIFGERLAERELIAANDADAWAKFCDAVQTWPSPKTPRREIIRGSQVDPAAILAMNISRPLSQVTSN